MTKRTIVELKEIQIEADNLQLGDYLRLWSGGWGGKYYKIDKIYGGPGDVRLVYYQTTKTVYKRDRLFGKKRSTTVIKEECIELQPDALVRIQVRCKKEIDVC